MQALAANAIGDAALLVALVLVPAGCGDLLTLGSTPVRGRRPAARRCWPG